MNPMISIAHISDLHFGTEDPRMAENILMDLKAVNPRLVAVSGDLTQRAKTKQFKQAAEFLDQIQTPKIIIPGNHDISLFNIFRRFLKPLNRFFKYISDKECPIYQDDEMAAVGVNSARSLTWKSGRINRNQIALIKKRFRSIRPEITKIIVLHHNIVPSPGKKNQSFIGRAELLLDTIGDVEIDLILAGHVHTAYSEVITPGNSHSYTAVLASAGTSISERRRGTPNSYNLIRIPQKDKIDVIIRQFNGRAFTSHKQTRFTKINNFWQKDIAE
jgi:3',5'-cyclic AMP phosphodiesterase CpdA